MHEEARVGPAIPPPGRGRHSGDTLPSLLSLSPISELKRRPRRLPAAHLPDPAVPGRDQAPSIPAACSRGVPAHLPVPASRCPYTRFPVPGDSLAGDRALSPPSGSRAREPEAEPGLAPPGRGPRGWARRGRGAPAGRNVLSAPAGKSGSAGEPRCPPGRPAPPSSPS